MERKVKGGGTGMEGEMVKGRGGERGHVSMVGTTEHRASYGSVRLGLKRET